MTPSTNPARRQWEEPIGEAELQQVFDESDADGSGGPGRVCHSVLILICTCAITAMIVCTCIVHPVKIGREIGKFLC